MYYWITTLEGLTGKNDEAERKQNDTFEETITNVEIDHFTEPKIFKKENEIRRPRKVSQPIMVGTNSSATNTEEIDQKISEYVIRGEDGKYSCGYCEKVGTHFYNMRKHVETHMEGLSFSCQSCDKVFRSRNSLRFHNYRSHRS